MISNASLIRRPALFLCLGVLALSACVSPSSPPPAPQPTRTPRPAPPPPPRAVPAPDAGTSWLDWAIAPGDWAYRADARGSVALFGEPGRNALFVIRCEAASRRIFLSREGDAAGGSSMTIRTSSTARTLGAAQAGGSTPYLAAELNARDDLLAAIAFSRGRFAVEVPGQAALAIPSWPEFTRVVEDCRR